MTVTTDVAENLTMLAKILYKSGLRWIVLL
jgi:hypothetical protein